MSIDPVTGIRVLESGVLEAPVDQSTASDELAAQGTDWPSKVELSRLRANLLRPLRFGRGQRVLVPDAGTGALARYLGEQGADVLALEPDLERARAAAARCDDLANVEVVCGGLDGLEETGFDAAVVVGVPDVTRLREVLSDDGVVVAAVANQVGLRVLLGWPDDDSGEPWGALEDRADARSRGALTELLDAAGLPARRWLFPFPDHLFPKVVLAEAAYERPEAEAFVDQIVGRPVGEGPHAPAVLVDDRRAHRVLVRAGLGPEVASSFLVVAGPSGAAVERFLEPDVVAWHFGGERMRLWLRSKTIRASGGGGLVVEAAPVEEGDQLHERGWLAQNPSSVRSYAEGRTLEQLALDACAAHDRAALGAVLERWRSHLLEQEDDKAVLAATAPNPLAPAPTRAVLPAPYVDVDLGNFVGTGDDELDYIDTEWVVQGGVSTDLACLRALWYFAERLVVSGAEHPWPLSITVDELAQALAGLCDVPAGDEALDAWRDAEAQLQAKVTGGDVDAIRAHSAAVGRSSRLSPDIVRRLPFTRLRRDVVRMKARNDELEADAAGRLRLADELRELRARSDRVEQLDDALRNRELQLENVSAELAAARAELAELHPLLQAAQAEVAAQVQRWDRIERLLPVRVFRKLRRLLA